ncbi:MAG: ribonuclease D [Alphaproteobacteria bacterium]|nr:ribonuclease D [Alphaproteobacteria bacterium]
MSSPSIYVHQGDIPKDLIFGNVIAVDSETMGLNLSRDRLCVMQISGGDNTCHIVKFNDNYDAPNLKKLFSRKDMTTLFHFGRFDIAIIMKYLEVRPAKVYCTKIASQLTRTNTDKHSLKIICRLLLGIDLSKEQQTSDWATEKLSEDQLKYAANDVLYLHALKEKLDALLEREGRTHLAKACFKFLPDRAALDLAGWQDMDIFAHRP